MRYFSPSFSLSFSLHLSVEPSILYICSISFSTSLSVNCSSISVSISLCDLFIPSQSLTFCFKFDRLKEDPSESSVKSDSHFCISHGIGEDKAKVNLRPYLPSYTAKSSVSHIPASW